eukprot:Em0019g737a
MSKKLINSPANAVDEALAGLVGANPSLRLLQGHRVIVRADIDTVTEQNKVTLVSGGGSGHEPAHAGFVGKGMLSAAVAGAVFASPPSASVLAALRAVASPAGTLVIVKNYTGDRLNFGIAVEQAKMEGMAVKMVVVGEDTALPSTESSAGRRGLCGILLVHKVAGALAEQGATLETVAAFAQQTANAIATLSISLTPCSLPGCKPSFNLKEDEMELGLGIHGEPGAQRTKLKPVDEVVATVFEHMTQQTPGYCYFKPEAGMEVALVVNNLGGTSNLELLIVTNAAIRYLVDAMKLKVVRVYVGSFMTSLEMAGVSFTLLNVSLQSILEWLDLPVGAPGWPNASTVEREDSHSIPSLTAVVTDQACFSGEPKTVVGLHRLLNNSKWLISVTQLALSIVSRTCVSHDFYGTASVLDSKVETVSHAMKIKSSWFNLLNLSCNSGYSTRHVAGTVLTLPTTMFQRKGKTNQGIFD